MDFWKYGKRQRVNRDQLMTRNDHFRESVYRLYMEFFEKAERKRRWNVFDDIPWEKLDRSRNDDTKAEVAETFLGVEMFLPDYIGQGIHVVRETFGQAWFQVNWGYEESKHGVALREYLLKSGQRTPHQLAGFEREVLSFQWALPFATGRQMTFYGLLQEQTTFMNYRHQLDRVRAQGDEVLSSIYGFIARDEAAHASFYRTVMQLELEEDRAGTLEDMALVLHSFRMPATDLVPDYERRDNLLRRMGGVNRGTFIKEVWLPILKNLGVKRQEVVAAGTKKRNEGMGDVA